MAWASGYLLIAPRVRQRVLAVLALDCVIEVVGITVQAWRHVPSHFNTSTPVNTAIAMTLAVGGAVLIATLGFFAVVALRGRVDGPRDLRLAVPAGFTLLLVGLAAGVAMIARGTVLARSGHVQEAYAEGGFLKTFHGVTLHGVLVLPALAWFLRARGVAEAARVQAVRLATGGYVLVAAAVLALSIAAAV